MIKRIFTFFNPNLRFTATVLVGSLFLGMVPNGAKADTPPISLHSDNSHYFNFRGDPTILITSGEHYSAVQNLDFDYIPYLNELEDNGLNYTRIFNGTYVDGTPDDLPWIKNGDVWIPVGGTLFPDEINQDKTKGFISPWARSNVAGYAGGGNKFDLDTWDTAYFNRLKDFIEEAGDRGIVVEVTFFCGFSTNYYWSLAPFNYQNNINNVGKFGGDYGPYEDDGSNIGYLYPLTMASENDGLLAYLDDMIEKTIDELSVYDNVFFELANEPYYRNAGYTVINQNGEHCGSGHGVSSEWQAHVAQTVIDKIATLSDDYLIAQNIDTYWEEVEVIASNTDPGSVDEFWQIYPEVDILNFHYAARQRSYTTSSVEYNYALNRPIGCDENGGIGYTDELYRKQAWNYITAGGAIFNNLDMSYSTDGNEGGQSTNPSYGFGGSPEYHEQLGILKEFIHDLDFVNMTPHNDLPKTGGIISSISPTGIDIRCLANEGNQYAVFVEGGSVVNLTFDMPAGSYTAEWINTKQRGSNGEIIIEKSQSFTHTGGSKSLGSPNYTENDIALRITNDSTYTSSDPEIIAYWKLDEGSGGITADSSGNGNDGTLIENPAWVTGISGMALDFDGTNDKVNCGNDSSMDMGTNDFTVTAWINMGSSQVYNPTIVGKGAGAAYDPGYFMAIREGKIKFSIADGDTRTTAYSDELNLTDNQWHHVAAVVDRDGDVTFYADGAQAGAVDVSVHNGKNIYSAKTLTIGAWMSSTEYYFKGTIDELGLYDQALSDSLIAALASTTPEPEPDPDPSPDAVASWYLDEGSGGITADSSGNGNDGTLIENPAWVTGISGMALDFDGTNDKVDCGNDSSMDMGTNDFTVAAWINMGSSQVYNPTIVGKGAGAAYDPGYFMAIREGKIKFSIADGDTRTTAYSDELNLTDNQWHHVAAVVDRDGDVTFYVDGAQAGAVDVSVHNGKNIYSAKTLTIGAWMSSTEYYFKGTIDELGLYDQALSDSLIAALASTTPEPEPDPDPSPDAVASWYLDEGSGGITADSSGNGNDGTLIENPAWVTGISGMALDFDGTNDKVDCGNDSSMDMGTNDFTVAAWINMGSSQVYNPTIVGKGAGAAYDPGYFMAIREGKIKFSIADGDTRTTAYSDELNLTDNQWHHIAAVVDRDGDVTFYVDGAQAGAVDVSVHNGKNIYSAKTLTIGAWMSSTEYYFKGTIDELGLYDQALSDSLIAALASTTPEPEPDPDPSPDAVASWYLDEGSGGITADSSGNGNDGTLIENPAWVTGISGMALDFDGTNDKVDCGNDSSMDMGTNDFTVAAWINMGSSQVYNPTIVGKGAGAAYDPGYFMAIREGKIKFSIADGDTRTTAYSDELNLTDNQWHHIAAVVDRDGDVTFYVDGAQAGAVDVSVHNGKNIYSAKTLTIGAWMSSTEYYFKGTIDELGLYDQALSDSLIAALASTTPEPEQEPEPVAHWENDEGSGNTTSDVTGNGNNGTLNNGPGWTTGISGSAISFDGANDYVDCGSNSDLDIGTEDFSIATWVKMGSSQMDNPTIVAKGAGTAYDTGYWLLWKDGKLRIYISDGSARVAFDSDAIVIADDQWHHVAVTINRDGDLIFYVDGVNSGSVDVSAHPGKDLSSTKTFTFGSWQTSAQSYLDGIIDDVRIYNIALSESQVNYLHDLYSANKSSEINIEGRNINADILHLYPNPSKGQITLDVNVNKEDIFTIAIFDIRGQMVATIFKDQILSAGKHQIYWNGKSFSSKKINPGMYLVRMMSSTSILNKTIVIME